MGALLLGWSLLLAPPTDVIEVFVRADCDACRLQQRVLTAMAVPHRVLDVGRAPANATFASAAAAAGVAADPARLPAVRVNGVLLPDDPAWPAVRRRLSAPPPPWRVPRKGHRVQVFAPAGRPACPSMEAAFAAAGVVVERADPATTAVAERLWLTLRLLGQSPRHGVSLPLVLVDDVAMQGCPALGDLAARLGHEALRAPARALLLADPDAPMAILHALNAARALPHTFLTRIRRTGWPDATLAPALAFAQSQPVFRPDPSLAETPSRWRVVDALSASDTVRRLLAESSADDRALLLGPGGGAVHIEVAPDSGGRPVVTVHFAPRVAQPADRIDREPMRRAPRHPESP